MNLVVLIGRLARDPDLRYTQNGTAVVNMTLAVDRPSKQGEEKQADFIRIKTFGKQAEACERHLIKGRQIAVAGHIQIGSYEKDGEKRYITDIIADMVEFIGSAEKTSPRSAESRTEAYQYQARPAADKMEQQRMDYEYEDIPDAFAATDDDVPF